MRLLHLWHTDKEKFVEIESLLGKNGLGLIDKIVVVGSDFLDTKNPDDIVFMVKFILPRATVSYNELSFGTQRVLIILLALLYDTNTTLLIEQPEDGIHTGLLRKFLPLCFTYAEHLNKQLIIATHSTEIIDLLEAKNIRLVRMTDAGTKVSGLDDNLVSILPEYIENEGTLSEFLEAMDDE